MFRPPHSTPHPSPQRPYGPGTPDRVHLKEALKQLRSELPYQIPTIVNGEAMRTATANRSLLTAQHIPFEHATVLAHTHDADAKMVLERAIPGALEAKKTWETMSFTDRAAIFLKAGPDIE